MLTWKYTLPAFLVPFAFTLDPRGLGLLLQGSWMDSLIGGVTAAVGVAALAMGIGGWLMPGRARLRNVMVVAGGLLLIHPNPAGDLLGLLIVAGTLVFSRLRP